MTKFLRLVLAVTIAVTLHVTANSQSVSINTTGAVADPSAILDVTSSAKGVLVPRVTKLEKAAITTPANALLVYQTGPDSIGFHYYDLPNTRWVYINASGFATDTTAWKITGNSNITAQHFLGTLNDSALRFKVRNYPSGIIDSIRGNTALGYRGFENNTTGTFNVSMGLNALRNETTGSNNVGLGVQSSFVADTASRTTAIGRDALYLNKHHDNVAVGYSAGTYVDYDPVNNPMKEATFLGTEAGYGFWTGSKTVGIGYRALFNLNSGTIYGSTLGRNVAIGDSAMAFTYSSRNVAIGVEALSRAQVSSQNVAIGDSSMGGALTTAGNVAVGYKTLSKQYNTNGLGFNTAVGYFSQRDSSVNTYYNTSIGAYSMEYNRTGIYNTGIGLSAMRNSDSSSFNTVVGSDAMYNHKKGNYNTAVGYQAGRDSDTAYEVALIGTQAGLYNRVPYSTALGTNSMFFNNRITEGNPREGKENTAIGQLALFSNALGNKNTAVGYHALTSNIAGYWGAGVRPSRNTAVGDSAANATNGSDNVAIGNHALSKNGGGSDHVAVGSRALFNSTATYPNTAIGFSSQDSATSGGANTSVGSFALMSNKTGGNNTAVGNAAMMEAYNPAGENFPFDNTAVGNDALRFTRYYGQTAIGAGALRNDTAGIYNTAVGYLAMYENKTGTVNTAIGTSALRLDTSGSGNTALGVNALYSHRTGNNNIAIGYNTLSNDRDGGANTAIGNYALLNHKTNGLNTAVGYESMGLDTSGSVNTALGWRSLYTVKNGFENVALGVGTIEFSDSSYRNTAVGRYAMFSIGGTDNTALGYRAMGSGAGVPTTGLYTSGVTSIGANSGYRNTGAENTFVGYFSGYGAGIDSLKGIENTGLGSSTLTFTTTGRSNTAVGMGSLYNNSTGYGNIGVGTRALLNNTTANRNVAVGDSALWTNNTGSSNTGIGAFALTSASNLTNATAIGANAFVAQSNSMVLGSINGVNSATATTSVGIGITAPTKRLHVRGSGASGAVTNAASVILMEDNANSYFEMSTPNANENGILSSIPTLGIRSGVVFRADSSIHLRSGGNTTNMTIDKDGNVGIGTTAPDQRLEVIAPTAIRNAGMFQSSNALSHSSNGATLYANNTYSATNIDVAAVKGTVLGTNRGYGVGGYFQGGYVGLWTQVDNTNPGTGTRSTWGVYSLAQQTTTATNYGVFGFSSGGASSNYGTYGSATGATNVNYGIYGTASGGTTNWGGYFSGNVFTTGTYTPSDETLKSNIKNYDASALQKIMSLQTKSYNYNVAKYKYMNLPAGDQFGFLAQELEQVFPQLVTRAIQPAEFENGDRNGKKLNEEVQFKAVNYTGLIPVLTKAVQEQQQIIDKQQKAIDDLLKRVEKLEQK